MGFLKVIRTWALRDKMPIREIARRTGIARKTIKVVLINLVGGIGTIFGAIVGASVILSLEQFLAPFGPWVLLVQGVVFVGFVLVFRQGLVGGLQRLTRRAL